MLSFPPVMPGTAGCPEPVQATAGVLGHTVLEKGPPRGCTGWPGTGIVRMFQALAHVDCFIQCGWYYLAASDIALTASDRLVYRPHFKKKGHIPKITKMIRHDNTIGYSDMISQ